MSKDRLILIFLCSALLVGCATSDDNAKVGRAMVNTALVTAEVFGYGSLNPQNCELTKSEVERNECLQRNRDIEAAREYKQASARANVESIESYRERRDHGERAE